MKRIAILAAGLALAAGPALAHHGTSQYDFTKEIPLTGQVREYSYGDPHIWLWLVVPGAGGKSQEWSLEGPPLAYGRGRGWAGDSLKVGQKVNVAMSPLRDGTPGGIILTVTDTNGKVLLERGRRF